MLIAAAAHKRCLRYNVLRHNVTRALQTRRQSSTTSTNGLSFRTGPTEPPLFHGTIPQHFAATVSRHGDRPAVIARSPQNPDSDSAPAHETTLTYHDLDRQSNRLASSLRSRLGVTKGDRLAVSLGNGVDFVLLTYACFKLGAVLIPINPTFHARQVAAALRHLAVKVLVVGLVTDLAYRPGRGRSNEALLAALVGRDLGGGDGDGGGGGDIQNPDIPSLETIVLDDNRSSHPHLTFNTDLDQSCRRRRRRPALTPYSDLVAGGSDRPVELLTTNAASSPPLHPLDTINIQFTSGTTATPKAAQLTHTGILNNGILVADGMGLEPHDRIVVPPPLFHCFGSVLGLMATATTGAAILLPSPAFDPRATLRMCIDHDATCLYGVHTMFTAVLDVMDEKKKKNDDDDDGHAVDTPLPPRHLRKGIVAGSCVPASLVRRIHDRIGLDHLVICYGMTETSPVSCMTRPHDPASLRCASVGTVMPHTAVKIVDPRDHTRVVPVGERGELAVAGYLVMKGYYGDADATAEVLRVEDDDDHDSPQPPDNKDGKETTTTTRVWMYSGDEAVMDADGYVRITGRIKDLIIRGGENIHPLEVEDCLLQMPGVKEASVVGLPDDRLGESVAAIIIPRHDWSTEGSGSGDGGANTLSREAVRNWVRERLSSHLVPKHIFWVDDLPKTASGKIQKYKLQEQAKKWLEEMKK